MYFAESEKNGNITPKSPKKMQEFSDKSSPKEKGNTEMLPNEANISYLVFFLQFSVKH